ncbi:MAG: hypothetical protein VYD08_08925 [Pseudomonadota bacterium]|nr:hypothetical protein [Pseudomonadota bacterium]
MFKEGEKVRFVKAHASMNTHLKALEGQVGTVSCDSYSYGKTMVRFNDAPMAPQFNIANERLVAVT